MLSPGSAFLLAYLPSRHVALLARTEITTRVAAQVDVALAPRFEFARQSLEVERPIVAKSIEQLRDRAAHVHIVLPASAPDADGWRSWVRERAEKLMALPLLQIAWKAGETAAEIQIAATVSAHIAYLRCIAPDHPLLRTEAERRWRVWLVSGSLGARLMFNHHALLMAVFAVAACAANPPHTGAPATASSAAASAEVPFHASPRLDLHCTPNSATEEATCVAQPAHYLVPERFNNGPAGADERGYSAAWTAGTLPCRCTSYQEEERLVPFQAPAR